MVEFEKVYLIPNRTYFNKEGERVIHGQSKSTLFQNIPGDGVVTGTGHQNMEGVTYYNPRNALPKK